MRSDYPTEFNPYTGTFGTVNIRRNGPRQPLRFANKRKKSRKRFYSLVACITILGLFFYFKSGNTTQNEQGSVLSVARSASNSATNLSTETEKTTPSASINPELSTKKYHSLEAAVNKALEGSKGDYGLVIKHLQTGEIYTKQPDKKYEPGSLYKLWVMATVYDQILKGNLTEDQELTRSISFLNQSFSISPADAEQTSGTISLSVAEALNQMITISHNYSALLLTEKIKLSTVKAYLEANGFNDSQVGTKENNPMTTPNDIALFIEKLYQRKLVTPEYSDKMLDLMKKQEKNNKLPLYLPNVQMAHKTGELGMFSHDAGIVYTPKGDYIIVAFSETESPKGAEDRIAQVSKEVYDYFMSK